MRPWLLLLRPCEHHVRHMRTQRRVRQCDRSACGRVLVKLSALDINAQVRQVLCLTGCIHAICCRHTSLLVWRLHTNHIWLKCCILCDSCRQFCLNECAHVLGQHYLTQFAGASTPMRVQEAPTKHSKLEQHTKIQTRDCAHQVTPVIFVQCVRPSTAPSRRSPASRACSPQPRSRFTRWLRL